MVKQPSEFSSQNILQHITQILGQVLSESELPECLGQIHFLEPEPGKQFWQAANATAGIYIILAGKVRLFDRNNNLIASQEAGKSFGELTLFSEESFQPYAARAAFKLKLCYLPDKCLQTLIRKYPNIREHLYHQAAVWDLLLLCKQIAPLCDASPEELRQVLLLLEVHRLKPGKLPVSILNNQKLWLIRRGELLHPSGQRLTAGSFYTPQSPEERAWQVTEPTELYSLSYSNWKTALHYLPQLSELQLGKQNLSDTLPLKANNREQLVGVQQKILSSPPSTGTKTRKKIDKAYFPSPNVKAGQWWQRLTLRYPVFLQQSTSDCGAACLVMIGRYWGKRFSVNRVREIANVDRNGASLRGLAAAAESIGFSTRPVKATLDRLAQQDLPAIAHWQGKHYIVVYRVTRNRAIVVDPAIGLRKLSHAEFKEHWTGYALLLQPTNVLKQENEFREPFWRFFELAKPHWVVLIEVLVASILIQLFGLVVPLFTQLLLDRVVVQRSALTLNAIGLGLLIFNLFRVAMTGLRQYLLDHTANRIDLALIVGFVTHTFRLPLRFFEFRYVGDIISRLQENRKIQSFLTGEALSIVLDLLTVFVYVGLMLWYSWQLALLVLVAVPPFVLMALIATPLLQRVSRQIFSAFAAESSYLIEALTGVRTVKSMAIERSVRWHWEHLHDKSIKTLFSGRVINNVLSTFSSTIEAVATTALLWYGAWLVIQNQLTIGQLVAFNMLLGNVIRPFQRLIVLWNQLQETLVAVERIEDVIEAEPEEDLEHQPRQSLPPIRGHICFEQVTFRYHPESEVNTLENISFEVLPGQTVALVGRSGSGKTTISKLVLGLYPPTEGKILIDGYDIASIALSSLRQQIGVVDQDTFLFGGTIRENISIGHPEATLEDLIVAAQLAGAHQFIKELPLGYETQIGEGGGMLSGGQRQRLAIARALLGNTPVLILDEATSSLDAESERIIQTNLSTIARGRTILVIAHRLSTVRNADLILVLDRGVLIEQGTHEELMAKRGHYFYLNQQQFAIAN
ncbi:ATP-binding cassette domain-containing protein [Scytonema sp. UIC 10036]|uniref:peptidase domain-containing ABC transporter n=1 Tax=Scytonema sp. UIC 10036 TaxID=2304196 RepID=UPI0012DA89B2|nr:peptidase domain-containing ABC transporter [Scytonema sp. UIC 10036]MUG94310.1 ATP-binding cassette domain-containing protein [Scytonema sp. UIC 10036]